MKITRKQLLEMTISFHSGLHIVQDPELSKLLNLFDKSDGSKFLAWAPPIFHQNGVSPFTLVGRHLSFCIMGKYITKPTEIEVISNGELADLVKQFSAWDKKLSSALLADNSSSNVGVSRPTFIKRMRLESGQVCPYCKGSAALTANDDWRSRVKNPKEGTLKCPQCKASVQVSAHELESFQEYDLPTEKIELSRWVPPPDPISH
jgi:hypothetical protein